MDRSIQLLVYSCAGIELFLCVCFSILICFSGSSFVSFGQFMLLLFWLFYYYHFYYYYYVVIINIIVSLISLPFLYGHAGPPDPGQRQTCLFYTDMLVRRIPDSGRLALFYGLISFTHLFSYCHAIIYLVHLYIFFKQFL